MTTVNANATVTPPAHMSSQDIPPGNHPNANAGPSGASDSSFEKKLAELKKLEKDLQQQKQSLKGHVSLDELKSRAKQDRNSVLKELGLDDLIPVDANDPNTALSRELNEIKAQLAAEKQAKADADYRSRLKSDLHSKKDDYEITTLLGLEDSIFSEVSERFKQTGEMPDHFEIASMFEKNLRESLAPLREAKAFSSWFAQEKAGDSKTSHPMDRSNSLSSNDRPSTSSSTQADPPAMSRQERIAKLAQHIKSSEGT